MKFEIFRAEKEHLPGIAALEKLCFAEPWSESALALYLKEEAVAFAAVDGNRVLGYIGMLFAPDEGQILNLAVLPEARRKGIAKALVAQTIRTAEERALSALSLEVRASNEGAIRLYESFGFLTAGVRKGFYRRPVEDALVMLKSLSPAKSDL